MFPASSLLALFDGLFNWRLAMDTQFGYLLTALPAVLIGCVVGLVPGWLLGLALKRHPAVPVVLTFVPWRTVFISTLLALPVLSLMAYGLGEESATTLVFQSGFAAGMWLTGAGLARASAPRSLPLGMMRAARTAVMVALVMGMISAVIGGGGLGQAWVRGTQILDPELSLQAVGQSIGLLLLVDWALAVPQAVLTWFAARRTP